MREIIRHIQSARKNAGLNVDDRICLSLASAEDDVLRAIDEHGSIIAAETLATAVDDGIYDYQIDVKVEGSPLKITLQKA